MQNIKLNTITNYNTVIDNLANCITAYKECENNNISALTFVDGFVELHSWEDSVTCTALDVQHGKFNSRGLSMYATIEEATVDYAIYMLLDLEFVTTQEWVEDLIADKIISNESATLEDLLIACCKHTGANISDVLKLL